MDQPPLLDLTLFVYIVRDDARIFLHRGLHRHCLELGVVVVGEEYLEPQTRRGNGTNLMR